MHPGPDNRPGGAANSRSTATGVTTKLFRWLYRPLVRRAARQILQGRLLDPDAPERERWSRSDVNAYLEAVWQRVDRLLVDADLDELPTVGNRHNVFLAVVTTAAYQALRDAGMPHDRALVLFADIGWKIYAWMLAVASLPFRLTSRDAQTRIDRTLKALMIFPFNAPGPPGYEVRAWSDEAGYHTHWTHCPPQTFVRRYVERNGDDGELDAFTRSWCRYDWPGADILAGDGRRGHYTRAQTLSLGDPVCDMCWHGRVRAAPESSSGQASTPGPAPGRMPLTRTDLTEWPYRSSRKAPLLFPVLYAPRLRWHAGTHRR